MDFKKRCMLYEVPVLSGHMEGENMETILYDEALGQTNREVGA